MAFRSSPSPFQLLATLVLFALLITPMFASPVVEDHDHSEAAENGKQSLLVSETHSGQGKHSGEAEHEDDEASPFEDEKILGTLHRRRYGYGYGGLGGGYRSNCGGMGMGMGMGMRGGSSCICHCMNGRVATPQEVAVQSAATTKP